MFSSVPEEGVARAEARARSARRLHARVRWRPARSPRGKLLAPAAAS